MVSPSSFRHPSVLAKLATTADHISGGRIELGLGTGWSEIEHTAYGFPFLSMKERMDVLEEQLEIIHDGHWGDGTFSFSGTLLRARGPQRPAQARPAAAPAADHGRRRRPARGAARRPLRRRVQHGHADARADRGAASANIDAACEKAGREPIPFTVMTGAVIGADEAEYERRVAALKDWAGAEPDPSTWIAGTVDAVAARLEGVRGGRASRASTSSTSCTATPRWSS